MDEKGLDQMQADLDKKKMEVQAVNIFEKRKQEIATQEPPKVDERNELIEGMFKDGIKYQVANNKELQDKVLDTAKTYTETKMQVIQTNVDTEHKEAVFNNKKDVCESYGFNEKTTPIWATTFMAIGYSIMLAIWLFIGSFTFMPVIFVAKKISVGLKKTWIAVLFAILIYLGVVLLPLLIALIPHS